MATANFHARGHLTFGDYTGTFPATTDVDWGRTRESGVTFQFSIDTVDLNTAQTLNPVDVAIVGTGMTARAQLLNVALQNMNRALFQPSGQFTEPGGSILEQLDIADATLGSQSKSLFSLGAGPVGPRRIQMPNARLADIGEITQQKREWMGVDIGARVLAPTSGPTVRMMDLP